VGLNTGGFYKKEKFVHKHTPCEHESKNKGDVFTRQEMTKTASKP
jgi:hypothetical protein